MIPRSSRRLARTRAGRAPTATEDQACAPVDEKRSELAEAASLFRALGDRARLAILWQLRERNGICACDFQCCGLAQPTMSHHLKILRDAGLVKAEKCGLWIHYSLNEERLAALRAFLP